MSSDPNFSLKDNQVSTTIKRYEYAGAENVAAQIAKMLNESNRDKTKSYFVSKDEFGCSIVEIQELPKADPEPKPGPGPMSESRNIE
jgi:hypothetical protein